MNDTAASSLRVLIDTRWANPSALRNPDRVDVCSVIDAQRRGEDPTRSWRKRVHAAQRRWYPQAPPAVAATFVAQWVLQAYASAAVFTHLSQGSPAFDAVWVQLDTRGGYPRQVVVQGQASPAIPHVPSQPHKVYLPWADDFIDAYRPGIPMSSRQRSGLVVDVWTAATMPAASPSAATDADPPPRLSCCFLYALPGMRICDGCPRGRRREPAGTCAEGEHSAGTSLGVEQSG